MITTIENLKRWPLFLSIAIALIACEQAGFVIGWSSPVLAHLQGPNSPINVTNDDGSWIATSQSISSIFWSPVPALTMHYLGRKVSILIALVPYIIFWIMVGIAKSTTELIIARAIVGLGTAYTFIVIPVYLGEISPDNIRGGIGIAINVVVNFGTLWIYWIGTYPDMWISSLSCALPLLIVLGFYNWLPESPYFLLENKRKNEARESLKKLLNCDKVDEDLKKIESALNSDNKGNSFTELFLDSGHRRALFICIGTIAISQLTGGVTFLLYAHLIFQKAGDVSPNTMSLIKAASQLLTSIGAAYVVDNVGRKPLLIISCIGSAVFMFCEGIYFYLHDNNYNVDNIWWLPLVSMILFNVFQVIGLSSISVAYLGELFHPKVKAVAVCVSKGFLALMVSIAGKLYQVLTDALGDCVPFFVFAGVGILGVFFVVFCVPETKGKSLEEIQYYMKHKTYQKEIDTKM